MRQLTLSIAAGDETTVYQAGLSLFVKSATGPLQFRAGDSIVTMAGGQGGQFDQPFDRLHVKNDTGGTITAEIVVSKTGEFKDSSLTGTITPTKATTIAHGSTSCANAAVTSVVTPSNTARDVVISCPGSAGGTVYLGGAGVAAGEGIALAPGASAVISAAAEIFCRNDTGAAVVLGFLEVRD